MLDRVRLRAAADEVVAAAIAGEGWDGALTDLAHAAGARDAVLMRNAPDQMLAAIATAEAAESVAAFAAGRAPPNSRYQRVRVKLGAGFRVDLDDYSDTELCTDPFYQEFLRPAGVFWHANAVLSQQGQEQIEISFKRRLGHGAYGRPDVEALDAVLPQLQAATRIAAHLLAAESRGFVQALKARGLATIELDRRGRVLALHEAQPGRRLPLDVINRRLSAEDPSCQAGLERALASALLRSPGEIGMAALVGGDGRRFILQVHSLPGRSRDLYLSASAVAILIERDRSPGGSLRSAGRIAPLFALTEREAEVACLRAEGLEFTTIGALLAISPETARTYLKFAYDKMGVSRQAELATLVTRLLN